jgi:hypothetical protein
MQQDIKAYQKDIATGKTDTGGNQVLRMFATDDGAVFMPRQYANIMRSSVGETLKKFSQTWKKGGSARIDIRGLQEDLRDQAAFREKFRGQAADSSPSLQASFRAFEICSDKLAALIKLCANANGIDEKTGAFISREDALAAHERQGAAIRDYFGAVAGFDQSAYEAYKPIAEEFLSKDEHLKELSGATGKTAEDAVDAAAAGAAQPFPMHDRDVARDFAFFKSNIDNMQPAVYAENKPAIDKAYAEYVSILREEEIRKRRHELLGADPAGSYMANRLDGEAEGNASELTFRKECLEKAVIFVSGGRLPDDAAVYQLMEKDLGIGIDKQRAILENLVSKNTAGAEAAYKSWQAEHLSEAQADEALSAMEEANRQLEADQKQIADARIESLRARGRQIMKDLPDDATGIDAAAAYIRERLQANVFTAWERGRLDIGYFPDKAADIEREGHTVYGDFRDLSEYMIRTKNYGAVIKIYDTLTSDSLMMGNRRKNKFDADFPKYNPNNGITRDICSFLPPEPTDEEFKLAIDDVVLLSVRHLPQNVTRPNDTAAEREARGRYTARYLDFCERFRAEVNDRGIDLNKAVTSPEEITMRGFKLYSLFAGSQQIGMADYGGKFALNSQTVEEVLFATALRNYIAACTGYTNTNADSEKIAAGEWDFAHFLAVEERTHPQYAKARKGDYDWDLLPTHEEAEAQREAQRQREAEAETQKEAQRQREIETERQEAIDAQAAGRQDLEELLVWAEAFAAEPATEDTLLERSKDRVKRCIGSKQYATIIDEKMKQAEDEKAKKRKRDEFNERYPEFENENSSLTRDVYGFLGKDATDEKVAQTLRDMKTVEKKGEVDPGELAAAKERLAAEFEGYYLRLRAMYDSTVGSAVDGQPRSRDEIVSRTIKLGSIYKYTQVGTLLVNGYLHNLVPAHMRAFVSAAHRTAMSHTAVGNIAFKDNITDDDKKTMAMHISDGFLSFAINFEDALDRHIKNDANPDKWNQ